MVTAYLVANTEGKLFTMEGAAFRADNNLENDSRYFNEGIYRGYNFDVNNSR